MKITPREPRACVPSTFIELSERLRSMDRRLGYYGQERFVFFYYEPRGEEVIWNDGRSYGFVHRVLSESGVKLRGRGGATRTKVKGK